MNTKRKFTSGIDTQSSLPAQSHAQTDGAGLNKKISRPVPFSDEKPHRGVFEYWKHIGAQINDNMPHLHMPHLHMPHLDSAAMKKSVYSPIIKSVAVINMLFSYYFMNRYDLEGLNNTEKNSGLSFGRAFSLTVTGALLGLCLTLQSSNIATYAVMNADSSVLGSLMDFSPEATGFLLNAMNIGE